MQNRLNNSAGPRERAPAKARYRLDGERKHHETSRIDNRSEPQRRSRRAWRQQNERDALRMPPAERQRQEHIAWAEIIANGELVIRLQVARPVSRNSRSNIAIASAFTAKATIRAIITSACGTRSPSNPATTLLHHSSSHHREPGEDPGSRGVRGGGAGQDRSPHFPRVLLAKPRDTSRQKSQSQNHRNEQLAHHGNGRPSDRRISSQQSGSS